jgi:hypothetical protein
LIRTIKRWILRVPDSKLTQLANRLYLRGWEWFREYPPDPVEEWEKRLEAMERARAEQESQKRLLLTDVAASGKLAPVKSQLKNLLADLNRLTREPGTKTKLADFLGAPLTSVSRWLSGEREPGGETTLKMLRWVQEQESQPNTLGSATNTAKGKTQVRKSRYDKQT